MGKSRRAPVLNYEDDLLISSPANARTWAPDLGLFDDQQQEFRNSCSRWIVIVISAILALAGAAGIVVAALQKDKQILPLCPRCDDLLIAMYAASGVCIFLGIFGLVSAVTRMKPVAYIFAGLLILCTLALFAGGTAVAVYRAGLDVNDLRKLWVDAVKDDPGFVCDFQSQLKCSGFSSCCAMIPTPAGGGNDAAVIVRDDGNVVSSSLLFNRVGGIAPPNHKNAFKAQDIAPVGADNTFVADNVCGITATTYAEECAVSCGDAATLGLEPCSPKVENDVKEHIAIMLGILFGLGVILLVTAIAGIRMTFRS